MPFANINDISIHYQLEGDQDAPVLMLCNSLGTTLEMWEPQMATLLTQFQVLRYDVRGHGQSDVPAGPYRVEQLGQDAIALLDHLGLTLMAPTLLSFPTGFMGCTPSRIHAVHAI